VHLNKVDEDDVWLFSYGTLQQRQVQLSVFGRVLEGRADVLQGYVLSPNLIIAGRTGNLLEEVPGTVFRITRAELAAADAYEVSGYKRVRVRLRSGIEAFVYVDAGS
jgi:gamma-glutamylcyclotransferase (GGCT)/AIG2-like uncharacterized protein YtfP